MKQPDDRRLIVALTGASGIVAGQRLVEKSPWPVVLIASRWARDICGHEGVDYQRLCDGAAQMFDNDQLDAAPASGSVDYRGMAIVPCSANTLGQVAAGLGDTLISRAAHCQLKERRPLVMGLRETPLTRIDLENALKVSTAGAVVMPLSPPFYMAGDKTASRITLLDMVDAYVDRVLTLFGRQLDATWEDLA